MQGEEAVQDAREAPVGLVWDQHVRREKHMRCAAWSN